MRVPIIVKGAALSFMLSSVALAMPVVHHGGKPGAAQSWTEGAGSVTLVIGKSFDAKAVAEAIAKGVPGANAKADGQNVIVGGVAKDKLLAALEKIDVPEGTAS